MKLNDSGLPLPGRELDAAVWGLLGHEVEWKCCAHGQYGGWYELGNEWPERKIRMYGPEEGWDDSVRTILARQPCYCDDGVWFVVPFVSTTHAFFQVVETKREEWDITVKLTNSYAHAVTRDAGTGRILEQASVTPERPWEQSIEQMAAHAVCCCMWKAAQDGT